MPTPRGCGPLTKAEHLRYLNRELAMIRYDLATIMGNTRDALVRMCDDLACGIEERADYEEGNETR